MRLGKNPEKDNFELVLENYHRIIIPVYIPNFEGYFADSFEILKLCIGSLLRTVHQKTRITLYNNASHPDIKKYLEELYQNEPLIDQVFHSKENMGKINAILAAAAGNLEPLITISDADVLFKSGWQTGVEDVFLNFKEAGMVSPVPSSKAFKNFVNSTWYYGLFKGKLRFKDVVDPNGLLRFDKSLGNDKPLYDKIHLKKYLTISNKKKEAVVGCGHFVATLKREVFDLGTSEPAFIKIVGGVENKFIDVPNDNLGYLRLATKNNYAYHLGNTLEDWMHDEYNKTTKSSEEMSNAQSFTTSKKLNKTQILIGKICCKFLLLPAIKSVYFNRIGLSKSASGNY